MSYSHPYDSDLSQDFPTGDALCRLLGYERAVRLYRHGGGDGRPILLVGDETAGPRFWMVRPRVKWVCLSQAVVLKSQTCVCARTSRD